ncbi:MAG TPA: hypothetical protein VMK65_10825 [Longimicrobiales bacterium]|nr:hypothetical protein [Longimicrobiales bacterium]
MSGRLRPMLALLAVALVAGEARAQSVRVSGSTSVRYVELRPLVRDSVPAQDVEGTGLLRQLPDGRVVRCVPGEAFCRDTRVGERASTVPVIHDVQASAWGLGEGVRVFAHLRARDAWADAPGLWPRAEDALELLAAYGDLERDRLRVRAGRQWKVSGLGFYNFDGVSVGVRPSAGGWVEAYGGRSLMRGLSESRTGGALEAIESLAPPASGLLLGVQGRWRSPDHVAASATYQVDFRPDGEGVYSELAIADGIVRLGAAAIEGSVEVDAAAGDLNEARVRLRSAPIGPLVLHGEARRYRPYFELWTIWGAFSPVGFDEVRGGATWAAADARLLARLEGSYRAYPDSETDAAGPGFRHIGWGLGGNVTWTPSTRWRVDGAYRADAGFGAARRDGHVNLLRRFGDSGTVSLHALAFQRLFEFRLDEGTVAGLGAEGTLRLGERVRASGSFTTYRHLDAGSTPDFDWSQRRGSLRVEWTLGPEPGRGGTRVGSP